MPPEIRLVPPWMSRLVAFAGTAGAATVSALVVCWAMLLFGVASDRFFAGVLFKPDLVLAVAVACGVAVGLAGASGRGPRVQLGRAAAVAAILFVLGTTATIAWPGFADASFSAERFAAAVADDDFETIEREAYRAVEEGALIGLSPAGVRDTLGRPDRVQRRGRRWLWHVGMINDAMGPGDAGALYVTFDPARARVIRAAVTELG